MDKTITPLAMTEQEQQVFQHLSQFVSDHKKEFVERVLSQRTRRVTIVLEDIFQSQNASAVVRTSECMGLQDVHVVENIAAYQFNVKVLKGADKWIDVVRHRAANVNNTEVCFNMLREKGYRILAADPAEDGISIDDVNPEDGNIALLFGNELRGVSSFALENCDQKIRIPMYGFTESLNISVSVAMCLNSLLTRIRTGNRPFGLSPEEKDMLRLEWYRKIVKRSEIVEQEFLRTIQ